MSRGNGKKKSIFSFFSGSGLLDLGFENAGYDIVFVNEYFAPFMTAYKYSREQMGVTEPRYGYAGTDINEYLTDRKEELSGYVADAKKDSLVGFIGGPPCPDFSIAGKQKGKSGDNGKLSQSYIDLIIEHQPDFFLFENVKGLWRTKKHREFYDELKTQLEDGGYRLTDRLTNAIEFGAPQDRDRILLFGVGKGTGRDVGRFNWEKRVRYYLEQIKEIPWPETDPFAADGDRACPDGVIKELTVQHWFDKNHVETHPNADDYFKPRAGIAKMEVIDEGDDSKKSYKRLHRWRYSPTVAYGNNEVHLHPYKVRRLSVAEAMALQSLPEEFVLPPDMSLSNKFKTIGNGVPYLLAYDIAETISDFLEEG